MGKIVTGAKTSAESLLFPIFILPSDNLRPKIHMNHIIYLLLKKLIINQPERIMSSLNLLEKFFYSKFAIKKIALDLNCVS